MTDHPIIFSGPMVLALLAGRKTMTRRLKSSPLRRVQPGDRLWVRESLGFEFVAMRPTYAAGPGVVYIENVPPKFCGPQAVITKSRPAIHMPRWASRLTLTVTAKKTERLNRISRDDVRAEGVPDYLVEMWRKFLDPRDCHGAAFGEIWDSLHGKGSWDSNPEIDALTFTVAQVNIDRRAP